MVKIIESLVTKTSSSTRMAVLFTLLMPIYLMGFFVWEQLPPARAHTPVKRGSFQTSSVATVPFYDGFESGTLGDVWSVSTSNQGRVQVGTYQPYTGTYGVQLDDAVNDSIYSLAGLVLSLDLTGESGLGLSFWWREYIDENHFEDGVFISDDAGATWYQVFSFNNSLSTYQQAQIDLDAAAAANGLAYNDQFRIKFQYYDDDPIPADGYIIDEVSIERPSITATPSPLTDVAYQNYTNTHELMITNPGGGFLHVMTTTAASPLFSVSPLSLTLAPGEQLPLTVSSTPTQLGTLTTTLTLFSDAANAPTLTIPVTLTVLDPPIINIFPNPVDATLDANTTQHIPLTVTNTGSSDLTYDMTGFLDRTAGETTGQMTLLAPSPDYLTCLTADPSTGHIYAQANGGTGFYRYDPFTDAWQTLANAPLGSGNNGGATFLGGKLYTAYTSNDFGLGVYDIATDSWSTISNGLGAGTGNIASDGHYLYLVYSDLFARYDPDLDTWTTLASPPFWYEAWGGMSHLAGKLFAHSGNGTVDFASYDIDSDTWTVLPSLPQGAVLGSAIDPIDQVYYAYGDYGGTNLYSYDIVDEVWSQQVLPFSVNDGGLVRIGQRDVSGIYFVQGESGTQFGRLETLPDAPNWLHTQPVSGTVAAGASELVTLTLDATGLITGVYTADLLVHSNDPATPEVSVPITMHVIGDSAPVISPTLLQMGTVFVNQTENQFLQVDNTAGTNDLIVYGVTSSDATLSVSPTSFTVPPLKSGQPITVTYAPLVPGPLTATLTFTTNSVISPVVTVDVHATAAEPPVVTVTPTSVAQTLFAGQMHTFTLTVGNVGHSDLDFALQGATSLEDVLAKLNENYQAVTDLIPNRFDFFEGEAGIYIGDGGDDMYDGGNILNTNFAIEIPYVNDTVVDSGAFGANGRYFTRKYPGLFVLAADLDNVSYFELTGNLGADGSGSVDGAVLQTTLDGVTYYGFVKRVYNAFDPSVNHLVIVTENAANHAFTTNTDDDQHQVTGLSNETRLYYLLYAGDSGFYINNAAAQAVMNRFLETITQLSDVGWLTAVPLSGTVPVSASLPVAVTLDATNLISDTYVTDLVVASNDPVTPGFAVPITLNVIGEPTAVVSPTTLNLGSLFVFDAVSQTIQIQNQGTANLIIDSITTSDPDLSVALGSGVLPPLSNGQSLTVTYAPTIAQNLTATLTITTNDPTSPVFIVDVFATATDPPIFSLSPTFIEQIAPPDTIWHHTLTLSNTGSSPLVWSLSTSGQGITDNFDPINNALWQSISSGVVTSGRCGAVSGSALNFYGSGVRSATTIPLNVSSGGIVSFYIRISATSSSTCENADSGEYVVLEYSTNNGATWTAFTSLFENSYSTFTYVEVPIPDVARTGSTQFRWRQLSHSGSCCDHWAIDQVTISGSNLISAVSPVSGTLPVATSTTISLTLDSTGLLNNTYYDLLLFDSNDPITPQFTFPITVHVDEGDPIAAISPDLLNFDTVYTGQTAYRTILVENPGLGHLEVYGITANSPLISAAPTQFGVPVLSNGRNVSIAYSPLTPGVLSATLTITTNDPINPIHTVALVGAAVDPPVVQVTPLTISETVKSTTIRAVTVTISNTGSSNLSWQIATQGTGGNVGVVGASSFAMYTLVNNDSVLAGRYTFTDLGNNWNATTIAPYDILLVAESDNSLTTTEAAALLDFYNSGRSIILGMDDVDNLASAIRSQVYTIFGVTNARDGSFNFGTLNAAHPIAQSVTTISNFTDGDNDYYTANGATWVVRGVDGNSYVMAHQGTARTVIMGERLNTWYSASPNLIRNALLWTSVPWLSAVPDAGTTAPGTSVQLFAQLDATNFFSGTYTADLLVLSNDPLTPQVTIPVTMNVAEHNAGPTDPALSQLEVAPFTVFANGADTTTIVATLRDANGDLVTNRLIELIVSGSDNVIAPGPQLKTDVHGQATFTLASSAVETKIITVEDLTYNVTLPATLVDFIWPPADPNNTVATISPASVVVSSGENRAAVTLTVRDVFGRPLVGRDILLSISGASNSIFPMNTQTTDANGQVFFEISSIRAGTKQISMRDISADVAFQVGTIQYLPGPVDADRSRVRVSGSDTAAANGIDVVQIQVITYDIFGNSVPNVAVTLGSTSPVGFVQPQPTNQNGQTLGQVYSAQRGTVDVNATAGGVLLTEMARVYFQAADLVAAKSAPPEVGVGRILTYTIAVDNVGLLTADTIVLTDTLPADVTYLSDTTPAPVQQIGDQLIWQLGDLTPGQSLSFDVVVQVSAGTNSSDLLVNQVQVTSNTFDENPASNTTTATTTVRGADMAVTKSGPANAIIGHSALYNITVRNVGQLPATGVIVTDTLPISLTFVTHSSFVTPTFVGDQIGWALGDFAPGESVSFGLIVQVTDTITVGQTIQNVVEVASFTSDDNLANNVVTNTTSVIEPYDHAVSLSSANPTVVVGTAGQVAVRVDNTGPLPDAYSITVEGLDPAWYTPITESIPLNTGEFGTENLNFFINTCVVMPTVPFTVRVHSQEGAKIRQTNAVLNVQSSPSQSNFVPANGTKIGSRSVLLGWRTDAPTTGRLVLYPTTQPTQTTVYTTSQSTMHNVRLNNLTRNVTYGWYVESTSACGTATSPPQTFTVGNGIVFTEREPTFTIHHDYAQSASLTVRNTDFSRAHTLRVLLENPYEDLIANFIGVGSIDDGTSYITLAPGESRTVTLAVHAQDAALEDYDLSARVVANEGTADEIVDYANIHLRVLRADQFSVTLIHTHPDTLVRTYRVTNEGLPITDLNIRAVDPETGLPGQVLIQPTISHARLGIDQSLEFRVIPLFSPDDARAVSAMNRMHSQNGRVATKLQQQESGIDVQVEVYAGGNREELIETLGCEPPDDLYAVTLPNVRVNYTNGDWYCTNKPNISFNINTPGAINGDDILGASMSASFSPHSEAQPHSSQFYLNGAQVGGFSNDVPVGTYLYSVDPASVRTSSNPVDVVAQQLELNSQHPNDGHYIVGTNFRLDMVLSSYTQYVCASSPEEALEKAQENTDPAAEDVDVTITEPAAGSDVGVGQKLFIRATVDDYLADQIFYPTTAIIYYQDHEQQENLDLKPSTQVIGSRDVYEVTWEPAYTGTIIIQVETNAYTVQDFDTITVNGIELENPPDLTVTILNPPQGPIPQDEVIQIDAEITNLADAIDETVIVRFEYYYLELSQDANNPDLVVAEWVLAESATNESILLQLDTGESTPVHSTFTVPFFANYLVIVTVDPES